jgi:hypothetical protein
LPVCFPALKKLEPSAERLLGLLHRWRNEAVRAGKKITRIALAFEAGRAAVAHTRLGTCWQPGIKRLTILATSLYNGWRMEDNLGRRRADALGRGPYLPLASAYDRFRSA